MKIADIANEIYIELGQPAVDPTMAFIITWLRYNVGELSILIGEDFAITPDKLEIDPELNDMQKSIFKKMFLVDYYRGLIEKSLSAAGYLGNEPGKIGWVSLREGDSQITRANPNEVAKSYRSLMKDQAEDLDGLVKNYKANKPPIQLVGNDTTEESFFESRAYNSRNINV